MSMMAHMKKHDAINKAPLLNHTTGKLHRLSQNETGRLENGLD